MRYRSFLGRLISAHGLAVPMLFALSFSSVISSSAVAQEPDSVPPVVTSDSESHEMGGDSEVIPPLVPLSLTERYDLANVVTLVRILRKGNLINPASGTHGFIAIEGAAYSAELIKTWKGSVKNPMGFRVFFSHCLSSLEIQKEYLVFAQYSIEGILQAVSCEDMLTGQDSKKAQLALQIFDSPA